MKPIEKTDRGVLIPHDLLTECGIDLDTLEVETTPGKIILKQSRAEQNERAALIERIDRRSEAIYQRVGIIGESSDLIREDREVRHR